MSIASERAYLKILAGGGTFMKHIGMFRATLLALAASFTVLPATAAEKVKSLKPKYTSLMTVSGYTGESELENFPVAVRISPDNISGFSYGKCDGQGDISFSDADGNILPHEVEVWNTEGESVAWVSVPKLSTVVAEDTTTYTTFKMHWGHETKLADSKPQDVWTVAKYSAVWHMNLEDGGVKNSAGNDLSFANNSCSSASTSKVGGGVKRAPGETTCANIFSALKPFSAGVQSGVYISGWGYFKGYKSSNSSADKYVLYMYSRDERYFKLRLSGKTLCYNYRTSTTKFSPEVLCSSGWFHWAINFKPGSSATKNWTHEWWINGEKKLSIAKDYDFITTGTTMTLRAGGTDDSTDECRTRIGAVSDDWIKAEYDSINNKQFVVAAEATKNSYGLSIIVR